MFSFLCSLVVKDGRISGKKYIQNAKSRFKQETFDEE